MRILYGLFTFAPEVAMEIVVRVVAFTPEVGIQRVHHDEPMVIKFIVVREETGDLTVVMGWTSQHRALAMLHRLGYDMDALRAFYDQWTPVHIGYPAELFQMGVIGGGWIDAAYQRQQRVPAEDAVVEWQTRSLMAETPEELREVLTAAMLPHLDEAIEAYRQADPPPKRRGGDF